MQTILAMVDCDDEDLQLKGLTVLIFLATYQSQSLQVFQTKDMSLAFKVANLPQLLEKVSQKHDTSSLAKVFLMTMIRDSKVDFN